jgi:hypothetical protein
MTQPYPTADKYLSAASVIQHALLRKSIFVRPLLKKPLVETFRNEYRRRIVDP